MNDTCEHCGGTGMVRVPECTCGGTDIGVGIMHEPGCGLDRCDCTYSADEETADE